MTTGLRPERLGIYGFRNRVPGSYRLALVSAADVAAPRIWDLALAAGQKAVVVGVPPGFPPRDAPGLVQTGCFLTPNADAAWVAPAALAEELTRRHGPYLVDVEGFRGGDEAAVLAACHALTRQRFGLLRYLVVRERPDFAMVVDIAPDRLHHALLRHLLPEHPGHEPGHPFVALARRYYRALDAELGATLALAGPQTTVIVASDHGVRPLAGGFCLNEWLIAEGLLVLHRQPTGPTPLEGLEVDWSRTRVFGEGGYHGRVFLNLAGREPAGIVTAAEAPALLARIADRLADLRGPDGRALANRCFAAADVYPDARGLPPDLTLYADDLALRVVGTVGHGRLFLPGTDRGADDANHDPQGLVVVYGPRVGHARDIAADITDVFATACDALGLTPPAGAAGHTLRAHPG